MLPGRSNRLVLVAALVTGACAPEWLAWDVEIPLTAPEPCLVGPPVLADQEPAVHRVCEASPSCCASRWDSACVDRYEQEARRSCHAMVVTGEDDAIGLYSASERTELARVPVEGPVVDLAIGDPDRDGKIDVAWVDGETWNVVEIEPSQRGRAELRAVASDSIMAPGGTIGFGATSIEWVDWDGDHDLDLAIVGYLGIALVERDGARFRTVRQTVASTFAMEGVWIDDDGDGDLDLIHGQTAAYHAVLQRQIAPAVFASEPLVSVRSDWVVRLCAVSSQRGRELLTVVSEDETASVLLSYPRQATPPEPTGRYPLASSQSAPQLFECADLDDDGQAELVVAPYMQFTQLGVVRPDGGGASLVLEPRDNEAFALALGDIDGDGDLDIVTGNGDQLVTVRNLRAGPGLRLDTPQPVVGGRTIHDVELAPLPRP